VLPSYASSRDDCPCKHEKSEEIENLQNVFGFHITCNGSNGMYEVEP